MQREMEFDRVRAAIGDSIVRFLKERLASGRVQFHADELRRYVTAVHPTAPASADRILRSLRQDGVIAYQCVDRSKSLYEVLEPAAKQVA